MTSGVSTEAFLSNVNRQLISVWRNFFLRGGSLLSRLSGISGEAVISWRWRLVIVVQQHPSGINRNTGKKELSHGCYCIWYGVRADFLQVIPSKETSNDWEQKSCCPSLCWIKMFTFLWNAIYPSLLFIKENFLTEFWKQNETFLSASLQCIKTQSIVYEYFSSSWRIRNLQSFLLRVCSSIDWMTKELMGLWYDSRFNGNIDVLKA